jgi:hypothetical protein
MRRKLVGLQVVTLGLSLTGCEVGLEDEPSEGERGLEADQANEPQEKHCKVIDAWEPNPDAEQATAMAWDHVDPELEFVSGGGFAYLCAGEEDWYSFETESLDFEQPFVTVTALVEGADFCACQGQTFKDAAKRAITVELYRADTMALLFSSTDVDATIGFQLSGDQFSHDLLIRVFSPTPNAKYSYELSVSYNDGSPGDDCEC